MPKSMTLIVPSGSIITFCDFISLWTIPLSCACCNALKIWIVKYTASFHFRTPCSLIYSAREMPSMYSITINCICSLKPTSYIFTMFGCESNAIALDSLRNLLRKSSLPANSFLRIFTATILSSVISFAL